MPVPSDVLFYNTGFESMTYGQVRNLGDDDRLKAIKKRLDHWLVEQTNELLSVDDDGERRTNAPFPLVIMSCITLEALGNIFFASGQRRDDNSDIFKKAAGYADSRLSGAMTKDFAKTMKTNWNKTELKTINSVSDVIYKFFRNTMFHAFQGRGVYLDGNTESKPWKYDFDNGCILINPDYFWRLVRDSGYERMMDATLNGSDLDMRGSVLSYTAKLLK